jgi:glyoxylase-like metal-dependent hydrolase (beta-lactamase superfamily II)
MSEANLFGAHEGHTHGHATPHETPRPSHFEDSRLRLDDVGIGPADAKMLPGYDFVVEDTDVVDVGRLRLHAMHTPGHTWGSTCFTLEGWPILFSGDTLFPGGPGRTDFGGDFDTIIRSIDERLFPLPADTLVFPGHGLNTTIGTERPHLGEWVDRGF